MFTAVFDVVFCLVFVAMLLYLGMSCGLGQLRIFMMVSAILGFLLYLSTLSKIFLWLFLMIMQFFCSICSRVRKLCYIFHNYLVKKFKKDFQSKRK